MAASKSVNISLKFRDGTTESISQSIKPENGDISSYPELLSSINAVQAQCNQLLTNFIEKEKASKNNSVSDDVIVKLKQHENDDDGEEDDDDDDDDENTETAKEPPEKKLKT